MISSDLRNIVDNVRISNYGDNVSDHLVVELDLHVEVEEACSSRVKPSPYVNWRKLKEDDISLFRGRMSENLRNISDLNYGNRI